MKFQSLMLTGGLLSASLFMTTAADDCSDPPEPVEASIFFSEYVEGKSWDKAIELYNGSDEAQSLDGYELWRGSNGGTFPGATLPLEGFSLAPGGTLVVAHPAANEVILSKATFASDWANFNGDDALGLALNGELVDVIGAEGVDPGEGWTVSGVAKATVDHVLVRRSGIIGGNTSWADQAGTSEEDGEWKVEGLGGWQTLNAHPHGDDGSSCMDRSQCDVGLYCQGSPAYVEEDLPGCCVSYEGEPDVYECEEDSQCGEGFICITGMCSYEWMAETFFSAVDAPIPSGGTVEDAIITSCLGTVPADGLVSVWIEHETPSSLTVYMWDPARDIRTPIFNGGDVDGTSLVIEDVPVRASGDDAANGPWALVVEDDGQGGEGRLVSWSLYLSSRFD